jgi:hypothetical protein
MTKIIRLPDNIISKSDRDRLEGFGSHAIRMGHATRWRWREVGDGDTVFEIYQGIGGKERVACIYRDRERDLFFVHETVGGQTKAGSLEYVFAVLDAYLARLSRSGPGPAA